VTRRRAVAVLVLAVASVAALPTPVGAVRVRMARRAATCRPATARPEDLPLLDRLSLAHRQMELMRRPRRVPIVDPAARRTARRQLAAARRFARHVRRVRDARRLGYVLTLAPEVGSGAHWTRWDLVNCHVDPGRPAEVLTDGVRDDARVVALSYLTVRRGAPPATFADPNARWHQHFALCLVRGALVDRSRCRGRGRLLDGRDLWMLHAWVVPGVPNPWGTFAPLNPRLMESSRSASR
jgi:hypothetical protein